MDARPFLGTHSNIVNVAVGSEAADPKRGERGSWRSFSSDALSDGAKRPMHHRRMLRGGRCRCVGGGVDLGGHLADICLRIRNWVRVYLVGPAREAGWMAMRRFAGDPHALRAIDGLATRSQKGSRDGERCRNSVSSPSCTRSTRQGSFDHSFAHIDSTRRGERSLCICVRRSLQAAYCARGRARFVVGRELKSIIGAIRKNLRYHYSMIYFLRGRVFA